MPDNTPTLQSFYDTLASQGFTKKPYEEFTTLMRNPEKRRKLYDGLTAKGVPVAPSFEVFDQSMNGLLSQEKQQVGDWVTRERENVERQIAEATQSRDFSLADAMDGEVDGEAAGVRKKRDYTGGEVDENGKFTWTPMVSGEPVYENPVLTGITPGMAASSGNAQLADLDIAQRNLERAQETLTAPEKKDVSGIWGRIKAMGEGIGSLQTEDYLPIISGRSQAGDSDRMAEITNKINTGEPLSMTEQTLATAAGLKDKAASVSDLSSWYQGGEVIGAMAPYLGEMAMTSPVGSAVSGAVIGGTRLAQAGSLGMRILKGTSTLGISAGVQTPFMSMLPAAYSENRAGDYTVDENGVGRYVEGTQMGKGEAAYKALAQTYAEVFTEGLGEYGVKFMGVVAPGAKNAISKYIPDLLKKVSTKSGAMEFVQGFKKAAKFDGPFWEIGEEYANALMGSLLTADPSQLEYMFTQEGFTNVALPMFVMGAGFKAAEIPGRAVYRMNATSDLRKAERGMKEGTTPETYNAMVLAADAIKEGNIDKAQSILQGASDDMDVKSKAVALQYLRTRVNYDVMRGHIKEDYDSRLNSLQLGTDKMIQKIINKDGLIHQAVDKEGVLYYVLDKKAEEVSAENPAFALNAQTGEIEQVGAVPFDEISLYSIRDFEALMFDTATASLKQGMDAEEQIAEQTAQQAAQEEQIVANAEKSGIAPGTVVDYKGQQLTVSYVDNNGIHLEDQQQQPVVVPLSEQGKLKSVEAEAQPEETAPEQTGAVANAPAPQQEAQPQSWTIGKKTFAMQQQEDGSTFIPFEAGKDETKTVAAEVDDTQFDVVPVTEEVPLQGVPAFAKKKTQTVVKGVRIVPKQIAPPVEPSVADDFEAKKADIERRRQEALANLRPDNLSVMASDYLLTGGVGSILSSDYFIQALMGSFINASSKINQIRSKYANEVNNKYGNLSDFIGTDLYNKMMAEIRIAINNSYANKEALNIFLDILKSPTGVNPKLGNQLSVQLDKLNFTQEQINAKYDAELASLETKQTPNEQPITTGASVAPQPATAGAGTPAASEAASATSPAESNPEGTPLAGEVAEAQDGERKVTDLDKKVGRKKSLTKSQKEVASNDYSGDPLGFAMRFLSGIYIHPSVIDELYTIHNGRETYTSPKEKSIRTFWIKKDGMTLGEIAHWLYENQPEGMNLTDQDFLNIASDIIGNHKTGAGVAASLLARGVKNSGEMNAEQQEAYAQAMNEAASEDQDLANAEADIDNWSDVAQNSELDKEFDLFLDENYIRDDARRITDEYWPGEEPGAEEGTDGGVRKGNGEEVQPDGGRSAEGDEEIPEPSQEQEPAQPTPAEQPLTEAEQRQQRRQSLTAQADEIDKAVTKKEAERAKLQKAYDEAKQRNQVSLLGNAGKPQAIEFDDQADVERETAQRIGAIEREIAADKQQSKALREQAEALNVDGKLGDQGSIKFDESFEEFVDRATNNEEPAQQPEAVQSETLLDAIVASDIEKQAAQADPNPSDAQKEAGNYKKGHTKVMGFDVTIENAAGSIRSGRDSDGEEWMVEMQNHYGYFTRTEGKDGDQVDCFIGENPETGKIFIVDQINPETGEFDEHKVMIGFDSLKEAAYDYNENYSYGWKGLGAITEMPLDEFKVWLKDGTRTKEPVAYGKESPSNTENTENQGEAQAENPAIEKQPKVKINVIPNGETAFDKQARTFINLFLKAINPKDLVKFSDGNKLFDLFAVMNDKGEVVKLTKSPSEAYTAALNLDLESFHIVRVDKSKEGEVSYDYYAGSLFGDYDSNSLYDDNGKLKEEVKQSVIADIEKSFNIAPEQVAQTPSPTAQDQAADRRTRMEAIEKEIKSLETSLKPLEATRQKLQKAYDEAKQRNQVGLEGTNAGKLLGLVFDDQAEIEKKAAADLRDIEREINVIKNQIATLQSKYDALDIDGKLGAQGEMQIPEATQPTDVTKEDKPNAVDTDTPQRIPVIGIGDLHGENPDELKKDLIKAGIINENGDWITGKTIVQVGDVTDRGQYSEQLIDFLDDLQKKSNGKLIRVLGNHDLAHLMGKAESVGGKSNEMITAKLREGVLNGSIVAAWSEGDVIYTHAGIDLDAFGTYVGSSVDAIVKNLNEILYQSVKRNSFNDKIFSREGIFWTRGNIENSQFRQVVGHTVKSGNHTYKDGDRVKYIDTGRVFGGAKEFFLNTVAGQDTKKDNTPTPQPSNRSEKPTGSKQPWEMTNSEFETFIIGLQKKAEEIEKLMRGGSLTFAKNTPQDQIDKAIAKEKKRIEDKLSQLIEENQSFKNKYGSIISGIVGLENMHKAIIRQALSEGKPVPAEVLADYPELQKQSTPSEPQTLEDFVEGVEETAIQPDNSDFQFSKDDVSFERARRAYSAISFEPEKRGRQQQEDYFNDMTELKNQLYEIATTPKMKAEANNQLARYKEGYLKYLYAYLDAKGRTMSSMITGPAKFPTARNQKALDVENKRLNEFVEWEKKARAAAIKSVKGEATQEQKDDERWKSIKKTIDSSLSSIIAIDRGERGMSRPLFVNSISGFIKRMAANGQTADVKRALEYIKEVQSKHTKPIFAANNSVWQLLETAQAKENEIINESNKETEVIASYDGLTIENNYQAERVQLMFDEKPSAEVIATLKSRGFRWSAFNKAWQRKNTREGISVAESIANSYYKKLDDVRFRIQDASNETFYSPTEKALQSIKQEKGTAAQMKAMLLKNGAKQAEMDWMGWDDHFPEAGKMITKADVQEWIDQNRIEVEEVVKGINIDKSLFSTKLTDDGTYEVYYQGNFVHESEDAATATEAINEAIELAMKDRESGSDNTKFSQYVEPGGSNYKEVLLTMPEKRINVTYSIIEDNVRYGGNYKVKNDVTGEEILGSFKTKEAAEKWISGQSGSRYSTKDNFKSSHFDEPNILAHVRFNERTDANGDRVLFVEEFQSDWAQKGKKEGFKEDDTKLRQEKKELEDKYDALVSDAKQTQAKSGLSPKELVETNEAYKEQGIEAKKIKDRLVEINQKLIDKMNAVPSMPFRKTDQWLNLAMRRMIRYAAENGFDRIAWTNGVQQVKRYEDDLRKQVDQIDTTKEGDSVEVYAIKDGDAVFEHTIPLTGTTSIGGKDVSLEDVIGKDLAQKVREGGAIQSFKGDKLTIGGEGMKAFYDGIVPAAASKLGKPFGAKVETTTIDQVGEVQSLPITPQMQSTVSEGVPLFQIIGEQGAAALDLSEESGERLRNLAKAREMEAAEKDAKTIRLATGWERGADGLWRYEVADNITSVADFYSLIGRRNGTIIESANTFVSKELNKAYPQLKDIFVKIDIKPTNDNTGSFNRITINDKEYSKEITIKATDVAKAQGILVHEIQHAIQDIEGFARGGNANLFSEARNNIHRLFKDIDAVFSKLGYDDWLMNGGVIDTTPDRNFNGMYSFAETQNKATRDKMVAKLDEANKVINENRAIFGKNNIYDNISDEELYRRLAGEAEARNVQNRMFYTPEQRREKLLAETEDVAREDQIILMADTHEPAMSESNDLTPTQQKRFDAAKAKVDAMQQAAPNALPTSVVNDVTDIADAMRQNGEKESDIAYVQQMMIKVKAARQTVTGIRTPKAVYIVVTAHKNANDVVKTWIHEQAAHHGLDLFFENKQDKERFLVRLFDALGEEQMRRLFGEKRFDSYARRNKQGEIANKSEMAEEFLAYTAEARVNNQGIWDVIKQFIRELYNNLLRKSDEFLREKARKFSRNEISLQDDDILELVNDIVTASGRQVFSPRRNRTGRSVRNTDVADVDELSRFVARIEEQELPSFLNPTIEIDGKQRPTTNSKGQPIAANEEGLRNFYKWFGDSKVVDAEGRPLVVYHGTNADFTVFEKMGVNDKGLWGKGFYFTTKIEHANSYAEREGFGANVIPVYLSIQNPLQLTTDGDFTIKMPDGTNFRDLLKPNLDGSRIKEIAISNNNDGIMQTIINGSIGDLVAFSPTQIKSATGNDGSFDPENPDIRFRVAGQPDATNDEDLTPIKEGMTTNQKRVFDARRKLQDRMLGLRRLQEIITERGGKVPDWANPYNEENRSYSKTLFEQDRYNERLFKPLIAHIAAIGKKHDLTPDEVSRYMKAKHSLERHESGTDAISDNPLDAWNMDLVNDLITDFEGKVSKQELDTLWELTNKATWAAVEKIYQSGMMTRDQYLALQERGNKEWKHYVPLRGWKYEEGESPEETFEYIPMTRAANGRTVYNKALIKARGRNSEPDDPLGYISNIAQTSIIAGNHNHIGRQFLELMRLNKGNNDLYQIKELWYVLNPNTGTWEETIDRPDQEMIDASNSAAAKVTTMQRQLNKAVEIGDIALQDTLRDQIEEESKKVVVSRQINTGHTKKVARRLSEQHEFEVMDKGLKYVVITDPIVANAMARRDKPTGMLADVMTASSRAMGRPTRWLTQNFTAKNPDFVGPNWVRDASYAIFRNMVNDDGSALKLMAEFGGSMKANDRYLRKKINPIWDKVNTLDWNDPATFEAVEKQYGKQALYDTLIEKFYELGGATGYVHLEEPEVIRKKAIKEMSRMMNTNSRLDKAWQSGIIQKPGKALTYFATMSENHVRFATFVMEMKMGKGWNASTDAAKNASVNFNRKGTWTASLGGLWGFFNAQIQGGHNAFSMAMRHKGRFAMAATAFAVTGAVSAQLIAMMLAAGDGGDDKHYTEYDMMNNILIPVGEGKPIKIPLPFVFRSFWALGVSSVLAAHGKKDAEDMAVSTVNSVLDIFSPFDLEPTELKEGNIPVRSFIPTAITPAYDLYMNRDFTGGRVYKEAYTPEQDQYLPDSERGLAHTNPYLVKLTQALNKLGGGDSNRPATLKLENGEVVKRDGVDAIFYNAVLDKNPAMIEHVVEYYLGGRGRFMNNVIKSAYGLATGTMPESRNMPILNRFLGSNPQNSMVADYYKTTDAIKMNMHYRAELMKSGDYDNWIKLQENVNMSVAISIYSSLSPVIDMYNDQLKAATTDQERDEARKNRNDMIETFMSLYKNATKENDDE